MLDFLRFPASPPLSGFHSIREWREHILAILLFGVVLVGTAVAIPSIFLAASQGLWSIAITDIAALVFLGTLWQKESLGYKTRALGLCSLLYLLGVSFLFTVGAESQIYLMACPVLVTILLGRRSAIYALAACSLSLFIVGYLSNADVQVAGLESQPLLRWLVITLNFAFVNAVISGSIGLLLNGLERSLHIAKMSEERYRTAFVTSPDAMVISRLSDGVCLDVNDGFIHLMGWSRTEVIGRSSMQSSIWHDTAHRQEFERALQNGGHVENMEAVFVNRSRSQLTCLLSAHVVELDGENCVLSVARDITAHKKAESAILEKEVQVEAAKVASSAKSNFLAHMSHEIRTPMNGVLGMVDVLQQTDLTQVQRRMLTTIQNSSVSLLKILNDILDYSKIEAGKLEVERVPMQLREVVLGASALMQMAAQTKQVELVVHLSPDLPNWVSADPTRVQQVLLNLLGNALKFTASNDERQGRVELAVELCPEAQWTDAVQLRVTDNGIGMDQAMLDKLFQPFTQGDASTARKFGGTGLGLSITQQLVGLLGGSISVTSKLGQGSAFKVTLPLPACDAPTTQTIQPAATAPKNAAVPQLDRAAGQRILLAEDNETNREVIQEQLHLLGHTCDVAPDGGVALAMWSQGHYALLLTDCQMPHMDGFALTAAIRQAEPAGTHMPIIAVTANAMQGEGQRCLDVGMDAYVPKPVRLDVLRTVLGQWLK
jgi:PAS domain S-box-containing protein